MLGGSKVTLGIGLIGLGRHGARYARHLCAGDVPGATLRGFWTRDPNKGASESGVLGVPFHRELAHLIEASDALVVAVPAGSHEQFALDIAAKQKPLLLEKPLARNVAEGERIVRAFARVPLMVAQTLRFDPLIRELAAHARTLGAVRGFRFAQRLEPRGLAWEDDPEIAGGGVLLQTGIHTIDALRFVTGAERVEVRGASCARVHYRHNEDHAALLLSVAGGELLPEPALGMLAASKIGGSRHVEYALYFDTAGLEADLIARTLTTVRGTDRRVLSVPERPTIVEALRAFVGLVDGRDNPIPGSDALESLRIVDRAYAVARADVRNDARG
jgi:predicted dehydrogenase